MDSAQLDPRVAVALANHGVNHDVLPCDPALADTAAFCAHYGFSEEQAANTILVTSKKVEPPVHALCVVLATTKLDVNQTVRKLLGVRRASFADADATASLTGMMIGGVTPFGVESVPIYVDSAVLEQPQVVMGGGNRSSKVLLAPEELLKLPGVTVVQGLASPKPLQTPLTPPNPPTSRTPPTPLSLQEQLLPSMTCFGCGPANPKGLRIRSFAGDGGTFARFTPWPEHDNGLGFLNGGIICTLMDCHSATPMMLEAQRLGTAGDAGILPYVTAGLEVKYLRPTPLDEELQLWAQLDGGDESAMTVTVELAAQGKVRAVGQALWKPWRPRR